MKKEIMKIFTLTVLIALLSLIVVGCAQQTKVRPPAEEISTPVTVAPVQPAEEEPAEAAADTGDSSVEPLETSVAQADEGGSEAMGGSGRSSRGLVSIYFDFDKSNIREDQRENIEGNANVIKGLNHARIRIEGNCDERGTNEYNMALGERRALSAKKYLVNLGVEETIIDTISYGEERPLTYGHDELAWSQNRRDDFVIVD